MSRTYRPVSMSLLACWALGLAVLTAGVCGGSAQAAVTQAEIDKAIKKGVDFLKTRIKEVKFGYDSIGLLAIIKGGEPVDSPLVLEMLDKIVTRVDNTDYDKLHHFYQAGVELMIFETVDPVRYRRQIEKLAGYIIDGQAERGSWWYPSRPGSPDLGGDTSITQYAMLGLWAASRSDYRVPPPVWNRAAIWHIKTQLANGAFVYHPGNDSKSLHAMTVNAVASMCIARMYLYPNGNYDAVPTGETTADAEPDAGNLLAEGQADDADAAGQEAARKKRSFRFLEEIDPVSLKPVQAANPQPARHMASTLKRVNLEDLNQAIARGLEWMDTQFTIDRPNGAPLYYIYGLERMAALADVGILGGQDWYQAGAEHLIRMQRPSGEFGSNAIDGNSFAILFLSRATGKLLNRAEAVEERISGGLLAGGRGLPENLAEIQSNDGEVKVRKSVGPIDELLAELENPKSQRVEAVQTALVEQVQLGDREALIGQDERLLQLARDPRVDVRRTALWALGRSSSVRVAPELIRALGDPDLSVAIEAHNALCWLSRKPTAFGLPGHPLQIAPEEASTAEQQAAVKKWRAEADAKWRDWYLKIQPYDQRGRVLLDSPPRNGRPQAFRNRLQQN